MENINLIVSDNLKRIRFEKKMSLDAVAKLTGVSKSMLGQIERGDVNPTVSTIWKISNGLKLSFTELMSRPEAEYEIVTIHDITPLTENEGRCRNYPLFPYDSSRRFETYYIELDGESRLDAEAHPAKTQEFITVFQGKMEVQVNGSTFFVESGMSIRFVADSPHSYMNHGEDMCRLSMVIYYPG